MNSAHGEPRVHFFEEHSLSGRKADFAVSWQTGHKEFARLTGKTQEHRWSNLRRVKHEKIRPVIVRNRPSSSFLMFAMIVLLASPLPVFGSKRKDAEKAGAVLFRDKGCAYCHGVGGTGGKKAPPLTGLPKDKSWTPEKMTEQILNGGKKMPPFRESLTDEEVQDLVAYLRAKKKPVPPPAPSQTETPAPPPGE